MASSWPGSRSTARSSPTSPCATPTPSADSPRPPARRCRPRRLSTPDLPGAPPPAGRAPFLYPVPITSPNNESLKELRKLAGRRWRDKLRTFVAEGEDLIPAAAAPAPVPVGPVCVALWGVGDPGNVGTVLRSALAFGAGSVALGPGTADPFGHKAVRASMGALFSVPVARVRAVEDLPGPTVAL